MISPLPDQEGFQLGNRVFLGRPKDTLKILHAYCDANNYSGFYNPDGTAYQVPATKKAYLVGLIKQASGAATVLGNIDIFTGTASITLNSVANMAGAALIYEARRGTPAMTESQQYYEYHDLKVESSKYLGISDPDAGAGKYKTFTLFLYEE